MKPYILKVKLFSNTYKDDVEKEINTWLLNNPNIDIVEFKYSTNDYLHCIGILYKEE